MLFSKLKALLRKAAKRSVGALWQEIGDLLTTVLSKECANLEIVSLMQIA